MQVLGVFVRIDSLWCTQIALTGKLTQTGLAPGDTEDIRKDLMLSTCLKAQEEE